MEHAADPDNRQRLSRKRIAHVRRRGEPADGNCAERCGDGLSWIGIHCTDRVPLETYRTWDSGRRSVRTDVLIRANELALRCDPHALLALDTLARLIHVHRRTLHAAAKDGRLRVKYDTRTTFRRLRVRATLADAECFLHEYFKKAVWPKDRPAPLNWNQIPPDYDDQIRRVRRQLGVTQAQFAGLVGAARKAVV